jgi:hypothetical protein
MPEAAISLVIGNSKARFQGHKKKE